MPRHKDKTGFSAFDAPSRSDVGLSPRHGDRLLAQDCGHLPLFEAARKHSSHSPGSLLVGMRYSRPLRSGNAGSPDAPRKGSAGGRAPRLSMGHIDSTSQLESVTEEQKPLKPAEIVVYGKGSRADFPGISHLNPKPRHAPTPRRTPRGKVLTFSESSRRNLQRMLATIDRHAPAFTMCLSCPGVWDASMNNDAKAVFLLLLKQMTSSRDSRIRALGLVWKQEIQTREAVHFHFLLWGVVSDSRAFVHEWIASRWNALVCRRCDEQGRENHLAVHLHETNFQEVRNMAGYFSKYMDKDAEAVQTGHPIEGRWWGKVNSDNIPWAEKSVLVDPPARFLVICQRVARKLRQKRANTAKYNAVMREIGHVHPSGPDKGKPTWTEFEVQCGHRRAELRGHIEYFSKKRLGPYKFPGPLKTGAVVLVGEFAPSAAKQILQYAGSAYRDWLAENPF